MKPSFMKLSTYDLLSDERMQSESALQQIVEIHGSINCVIIYLYFLLDMPYRLKRLKEYSSLIYFFENLFYSYG
jgi:hypothetical protein